MAQMPIAHCKLHSKQGRAVTGGWHSLVRLLFGGRAVSESEATRVCIEASPEMVWRGILFYEEVPERAPLLLRALRLRPLGTKGDKSAVGASILCRYTHGTLMKQITTLKEPYLMRFAVMEQHLGMEDFVAVQSGSYRIRRLGANSEIALTTSYQAYLRPRWFWRRMERLGIRQLHSHILSGMREMILAEIAIADAVSGECAVLEGSCRGEES